MLSMSSGPFTCINCGRGKSDSIFRVYGKTPSDEKPATTSSGTMTRSTTTASTGSAIPPSVSHLKLTECEFCNRPIDDYVELETSILLIDALLLKSRFYRHLANCVISGKSVLKLAIILIVADSIFKWSRVSSSFPVNDQSSGSNYVELEYRFYLTFADMLGQNLMTYTCMHCTFWLFVPNARTNASQVVKILTLSSFVKLLNLLSVLWPAPTHIQPLIDVLIQVMLIVSLVQGLRVCSVDSDSGQESLNFPIAFLIVLFAKTTVLSMLYHGTGGRITLTPANLLALVV